MEKKLKINFILKGIAIFAFVAFCLLAILAGVTLPFVSNANTVDCAVASAESDYATASADFDSISVTLKDSNANTKYYGVYLTESDYDYFKTKPMQVDSGVYFTSNIVDLEQGNFVYPVSLLDCSNLTNSTGSNYQYADYISIKTINESESYLSIFSLYNVTSNYVDFKPYLNFNGFYVATADRVLNYDSWNHIRLLTQPVNDYYSNYFESYFGSLLNLASNSLFFNVNKKPILINNHLSNWVKNSDFYTYTVFESYNSSADSLGFCYRFFPSLTDYNLFLTVNNLDICKCKVTVNSTNSLILESITEYQFLFNANYNIYSNLSVLKIDLPSDYYLIFRKDSNFYNWSYSDRFNLGSWVSSFALFDYLNFAPLGDNLSYDFGYQDGLKDANDSYFSEGYKNGYNKGKTDGYNTGLTAGDARGFARGVESANTYSFLGLFGAIFDAPIKAIFGGTSTLPAGTTITDSNGNTITLQSTTTVNRAGLLNFNLMGVNLSGFVLALFSISIIVVVIKFALAKR